MTGPANNDSGRAPRRQRAVEGAAFVCILGLALLVRLYRINEETLHMDESLILRGFLGLHERTFADAFRVSREIDPPMTPVYFLVQFAWARIVGLTVLRLHLLSVLFSAATFVVVFFLGRKLRGTWTGLAAMFLLAVSPIHVYYSPEIRNYSLTALLGTLSLLTLLNGVERPARRIWGLNFAVDLLLGMSHLFANLLFVPQAIFLLVCHRRRAVLLPWLFSHAVIAGVVASWLRTCNFKDIGHASSYIAPLSWDGVREMLTALSGASYAWAGSGVIGRTGTMGVVITALFLLALLALLVEWLGYRRMPAERVAGREAPGHAHGVFLLVLVVSIPPVLLAVITQTYTHCFLARYVFCSAVAAPVLLACAVTMLRARAVRMALVVALVLTSASLLDQIFRTRPQRRDWTPLRSFLAKEMRREDYLVVFSSFAGFSSKIDAVLPVSPARWVHREGWSLSDFEELAAWHARGVQVWCVTGIEDPANAEFETLLDAHGLPFTKHVFPYLEYAMYCVPARGGAFAPPATAMTRIPMGSGGLRGWFSVDRHNVGVGMGMTQLAPTGHPYAPLFTGPGLGLRSVMDGSPAQDLWPWNLLRAEVAELGRPSAACVDARWLLDTTEYPMECRMRYALSGGDAVDMLFEVTPRGEGERRAPLVFTWVSRVRAACAPAIHFPGVRDGAEGWVSFGEDPAERGVVGRAGLPEEVWEGTGTARSLRPVQGVNFSEPVYYGLVDGDHNGATDGDEMALILMFEHPEDTRFALQDCQNGSQDSEWNWQFVIRAPQAGKAFSQRARMVCKPFLGQEDVLAEYRAWRDAPPSPDSPEDETLPARSLAIPGPDSDECDPVAPLDRLAALDPAQALVGYAALLEIPLYRRAAADRIDALYMRFGDAAGLAAQWEGFAVRDTLDAMPWTRLGEAYYRAGGTEKAAGAFARGLDREDRTQECRMGLMAVRFDQGNVAEAVALAGAAVTACPGVAPRAAGLCAAAGRARLAAGDASGAEAALEAAVRHAPGDFDSGILLGRLLAGRGETGKGVALFEASLSARPDLAVLIEESCAFAAEARLRAGDAAGAVRLLRRAGSLPSGDGGRRVLLAEALAAAGDDEGAMAEAMTIFESAPESARAAALIDAQMEKRGDASARADLWRRLAGEHPDAAVPRVRLGMALEASGDTAGTEAACRLALQRDPENALAKLQLGKLLGARGEIRGGLALIDEAVVNRGDLRVPAAEACAAAAAARVEAGRADDAVAAYRHARTLVPGACFYSLALAGALEKNGDGAGAESAYHEALQCDPGLVPAMIRLGALLVSRGGEAGRGFALFDQAVAAQPNTAGLAADACVDAGKRRLAAGDAPGAAAAFRNALVITPGVLGYRVELAGALEAAGEDTAALGEYRAVVAAEPESPHSSARMDALLEKRGEKAARVEEWRGLAAANPDAAIPQLYFGLALEAAGDAAGARAALEKALRINPDLAGAREALVRLETAAGNGKP